MFKYLNLKLEGGQAVQEPSNQGQGAESIGIVEPVRFCGVAGEQESRSPHPQGPNMQLPKGIGTENALTSEPPGQEM